MKISAVMPVFNTDPKYLREAFNSILAQSHQVSEIIIINDGSTRTETLQELYNIHFWFKRNPVQVIYQNNKKISGALNTGIRVMKGDWWAGCSSDDRWLPNKIKEQVEFIEAHPEAKVLYCDWEFIDKEGFAGKIHHEPSGFKDRFEAGKHIIREHIGMWSGMMIHKSVFDSVGLYNESFPTREDYEMHTRILTKHMMYHIPKVLAQYRLHREQISNSRDQGSYTDVGKHYCEMARDLAIEHFGDEKDRKEFPAGRY